MATKKTKKGDSAKKAAKKTVKKPTKKVAKKPAKKTVKKPTKKVAKKPAKKVAKKPAKKVSRKVTKKPTPKKVVRKTTNKTAKKTAPNPVVQKQVSSDEQKVTKFNFKITGYGSELAWAELDEDQFRFWRSKYDSAEDEYDAKRELIDHIRHGNGPQYGEDGHLGEHYNWNEDFEEYPFYQGSTIEIDLYGGDDGTDFIKCIELPLTDKKIKKSFYDGFVDKTPSKKKFKGGTVFAKTEDRGDYCIGEMDISEQENDFSLENFELSIEKVQGYQYVSNITYNDMTLDYEKANDPYNKDFDAWIVWQ